MFGKSKKTAQQTQKEVNPAQVASAMAKAVFDGDFVNLRLLFQPFSPARADSSEQFDDEKYAYLLPDESMRGKQGYQKALQLVQSGSVWRHIEKELQAKRPAQIPSELVLILADNAVAAGKYTIASQAYEVLRIRSRMQEEFFAQADRALDAEDLDTAVLGYLVGSGLEYNYAAFPEPLPVVPNFQTRALMMHGVYPTKPEDCVALQEPEVFVRIALSYLLSDAKAAARLDSRGMGVRLAFLDRLVRRLDPRWDEFVRQYKESCDMLHEFDARIARATAEQSKSPATLAAEVEELIGEDPRVIPAKLLGRTIPEGIWWQYLKDMAYEHPASALFVSRQLVGDKEIIVPRFRSDSPIPQRLGLLSGPETTHVPARS